MIVPDVMQYIRMAGTGGPEVLVVAKKAPPRPKPHEVLIRVRAAGVNRPDLLQRQGAYPPPPDADKELGLEVAGEVVVPGADVHDVKEGDQVVALVNGGGYAEYVCAPRGQCLAWPPDYSAEEAAALPETYFTVWANLFGLGALKSGQTALVHGGSSGIGMTAIRLGQEFGASIIATAGTDAKCKACRDAGAAIAVNYKTEKFEEVVREETGGRGVDVVLDMVGAAYFSRNLSSLAIEGRLVIIAVQSGAKADQADLSKIMLRRLTVTGSTLRARPAEQKERIAQGLRGDVWPVLAAGRCRPSLHATLPLAHASQAHAMMEEGGHIGKIVLGVA